MGGWALLLVEALERARHVLGRGRLPLLGLCLALLLLAHALLDARLALLDDVGLLLAVPLAGPVLALHLAARLRAHLLRRPARRVGRLGLGLLLLLHLQRLLAHAANGVGVQHDGLWLQLVQQVRHLGLAALAQRRVRVGHKGIKVGLARAGHEHGGEAAAAAHPHHILVGHKLEVTQVVTLRQGVRHVGRGGLGGQRVTPHLHLPPVPHRQQPALADVQRRGGAVRKVRVQRLERADVPHAHLAVHPRGDHVAASEVERERADGAPVAQHLDHGRRDVGRPHRDHAARVPQPQHRVPGVLAHDRARPQPRLVAGRDVAGRCVLVVQDARVAHRRQQEVVRQELQRGRLGVVAHAVHLHATLVVHVHVLFLRGRKHGLVVQEGDVAHHLPHLHLTHQRLALPVHHGQVALAPAQHHVPPAALEVEAVRPQLRQAQVDDLLGGARFHGGCDVCLLGVPGALHALCLQVPCILRQQPLVGLDRLGLRLPVHALSVPQLALELLVHHLFDCYARPPQQPRSLLLPLRILAPLLTLLGAGLLLRYSVRSSSFVSHPSLGFQYDGYSFLQL
mmetsp:Transcript_2371/g.5957  ORF Transcript_2371/g.5957 Transcript_2371/m.5957 type:complete len:566 (-) Transcript_2371:127-1824(-)